MNDIKIKATFLNSDREILFLLSDVVYSMGSQCAEDVCLEDEIGIELAYLWENWSEVNLEVIEAL